MKVKTPQPKAVEEDPAVKAQRLAAEKAATDAADAAIGGTLQRKTRLKARVFGLGDGSNANSGGGAAFTSAPASSAPAAGSPARIPGYSPGGYIWKGGMY